MTLLLATHPQATHTSQQAGAGAGDGPEDTRLCPRVTPEVVSGRLSRSVRHGPVMCVACRLNGTSALRPRWWRHDNWPRVLPPCLGSPGAGGNECGSMRATAVTAW